MCCNYFVDQFCKRKIEGKRGPLHLQGSRERDTLIFIWPETISIDGYPYKGGFLQFARKTKARFTTLIDNQIASLRSIKTQFGLLVLKFSIIRDNETLLGPLFLSEGPPSIFNKNNEETIEDFFIRLGFTDEVKGEIEEWSQSGSAWVKEVFSLETFLDVAV